jgi:hypothetical protein
MGQQLPRTGGRRTLRLANNAIAEQNDPLGVNAPIIDQQ